MRFRTIGVVLSAVVEVAALVVDLSGVKIANSSIPLSGLALIAFLFFAGLLGYQIWLMDQELHSDERVIKAWLEADQQLGEDDPAKYLIKHDDQIISGKRVIGSDAVLALRNVSDHEIRVSEAYIDFTERHVLWWGASCSACAA